MNACGLSLQGREENFIKNPMKGTCFPSSSASFQRQKGRTEPRRLQVTSRVRECNPLTCTGRLVCTHTAHSPQRPRGPAEALSLLCERFFRDKCLHPMVDPLLSTLRRYEEASPVLIFSRSPGLLGVVPTLGRRLQRWPQDTWFELQLDDGRCFSSWIPLRKRNLWSDSLG